MEPLLEVRRRFERSQCTRSRKCCGSTRWGSRRSRPRARVELDPKTVRRYVQVALEHGIEVDAGPSSLTDARPRGGRRGADADAGPRPLGENWS